MSLDIKETELTNYAGRRIKLETYVDGHHFWRVWYEGSRSTIEMKRRNLERDVEHYKTTGKLPEPL